MIYLDTEFYRAGNSDLETFDDERLRLHFITHGIREGRLGAASTLRENFLKEVVSKPSVLEIGPFCNPQAKGRNVRYFDVLDTKGLIARAKQIGYKVTSAPEIHYVSPTGDLSIVRDKFAAVMSCHCIEHQPDLIHHLQQVSALLETGGAYYVIIPDKRYCFDHFIAESTIAEILEAHFSSRRTHKLASVIEHRALTTHNDNSRHWNGDHGVQSGPAELAARVKAAVDEYQRARGTYIDVHAWQFTPESFAKSIETLHHLGYSPLRLARVNSTPLGRNEFNVVLEKA